MGVFMCGFCNVCVCVCGFCVVWVRVCAGFVMYCCVHVCIFYFMGVGMCGFCNVWVCKCGFCMYGCVCVGFVLNGRVYVRVL